MSKADELECAIAQAVKPGEFLPKNLPAWIRDLGVIPEDLVTSSTRIGSKSPRNKTDILIQFQKSTSLKISAKLSNADYFGNWYGHDRFIREFGSHVFSKTTTKVTEWANQWLHHPNASLFIGVSINFGFRGGNTFIEFLDIFDSADELIKIIAGVGEDESTANCLYISNHYPLNFTEILAHLSPINHRSVEAQSHEIKIICRPVNPFTEESNRGKNVYTKFQPSQKLSTYTRIETLSDLSSLGKFVEVEPTRLNHNHILNELEQKYNIYIPRKTRKERL
jgi:hypothetical protein